MQCLCWLQRSGTEESSTQMVVLGCLQQTLTVVARPVEPRTPNLNHSPNPNHRSLTAGCLAPRGQRRVLQSRTPSNRAPFPTRPLPRPKANLIAGWQERSRRMRHCSPSRRASWIAGFSAHKVTLLQGGWSPQNPHRKTAGILPLRRMTPESGSLRS